MDDSVSFDDLDDIDEEALKAYFMQIIETLNQKQEEHKISLEEFESLFYETDVNTSSYSAKVANAYIAALQRGAEMMLLGTKDYENIPVFYELPLEEILESTQKDYSEEVFKAILEHPQLKSTYEKIKQWQIVNICKFLKQVLKKIQKKY